MFLSFVENWWLEQSKEHFRALIEDASDLTLVIDETGAIRYASPSVERVLGYSQEQISGWRLAALLHPADASTLESGVGLLVASAGAGSMTCCRWRHMDGTYRWLESTASNLPRSPLVDGLVVHARDVTERQNAEEQVRILNTRRDRTFYSLFALCSAGEPSRRKARRVPVRAHSQGRTEAEPGRQSVCRQSR